MLNTVPSAYPVSHALARAPNTDRLPAMIRVDHGPREILGRFFLDADRDAGDRGVKLYLTYGLDRLVATNKLNQASWAKLMPAFNPEFSHIPAGTAFFIEGRDPSGRIVVTQAARLYDWRNTNLKIQMESLRWLYRDPATQAAADETVAVTAASAEIITGRVAISGGVWFHPDYRGRGLAKVMPRISRALAYTLWRTDWSFGVVEPNAIERNLVPAYGYRSSEPWIRIRNSYRDLDWHLMSFSAEAMLQELKEHMARREEQRPAAALRALAGEEMAGPQRAFHQNRSSVEGRTVRSIDVPVTIASPPAVSHGRRIRS